MPLNLPTNKAPRSFRDLEFGTRSSEARVAAVLKKG
jgi:hypothetical protein